MNGYLDRIVYAHDGSLDFRAVASSLGFDDRGWGARFVYYGRLPYRPQRRPSTWYWTDGAMAVVIRRLPGNGGDGRDDRAHALLGTAAELGLEQALALADDCPLWKEEEWYGSSPRLRRAVTSRLPEPCPQWERSDVDTDAINELWPIVHALRREPELPIWVFDHLPEARVVSHIRVVAGMANILAPSDLPWTFTTQEDDGSRGNLHPRIRFVDGYGVSEAASDPTRTVIRYDHRDATVDEEQVCRRLVAVYLTDGPGALERELHPRTTPVLSPAPVSAKVSAVPAPVVAIPSEWGADGGIAQPAPLPPVPAAPENPLALFHKLSNTAHDDELATLVRRVTQASVNDHERRSIRAELRDPQSMVNKRFGQVDPAERSRLLTQLLAMTAMRPEDWHKREATLLGDRLLEAIGGLPQPGGQSRRSRKQPESSANLTHLAVWLMSATILVLAMIVATVVTR